MAKKKTSRRTKKATAAKEIAGGSKNIPGKKKPASRKKSSQPPPRKKRGGSPKPLSAGGTAEPKPAAGTDIAPGFPIVGIVASAGGLEVLETFFRAMPAEDKASVNILEMARSGLKGELAAAVRQVAAHKQEVIHKGLKVENNGGNLFLNLTVKPILEQSAMRGHAQWMRPIALAGDMYHG